MRLIDEKDTLPKIDEAFLKFAEHDDVLRLYSDARLAVINAPTIDPESVRPKGEWITRSWWQRKTQYTVKTCSVCKSNVKPKFKSNFCPNCGADMRGDKHD